MVLEGSGLGIFLSNIPAFVKAPKIRIVDNLAEVRTAYLPKTSLERYLLCRFMLCSCDDFVVQNTFVQCSPFLRLWSYC
jgi:hypothetical protein